MKNNIYKYVAPAVLAAGPMVAFAQTSGLFGLLERVQRFMNALVPVFITLGLLYFLWGVIQYIQSPDDREKARDTMIGGILGLFVMVSVWGLVNFFAETVGVNPNDPRTNRPGTFPIVPVAPRDPSDR